MKQEEFNEKILGLAQQLNQTKKEDTLSRTQLSASIKKIYSQHIEMLINQLNHSSKIQKQQILQQLKQTDQLYLEAQGMSIQGKVLFSRHGECARWGQKKFGLNPNSPISDAATRNMATTNQSTKALLSHPDKTPRIAISPMTRPMETASLLIPEGMKANISIETFLTENSSAPSGLDVRSNHDLEEVSKKTPFFSLKRVLFFLANLFYGPTDFESLNQKRKEAADKIQQHNKAGQDIYKNGKIPQSLDYDGDKIKDTKKLINETTEKDLWLIGHGNNFKAFFKEVFGIEANFKFGETRVAYKIKAEGWEPTLYIPPYSLVVNQKTGEIEGMVTGVSKAAIKEVHKEKFVSIAPKDTTDRDESSAVMIKGLRVSRTQVYDEGSKAPLIDKLERVVKASTISSNTQKVHKPYSETQAIR